MNMTQQLYKNIERLLLLEEISKRLESSGYISILDKLDNWIEKREEIIKETTPIEYIMDTILMSVDGDLSETYNGTRFLPFLYYKRQKQIGKYRVDFLCSLQGVKQEYIIECDGHDFHEKTKEQAKYDKQRERYLVSLGYKVLRFSGSEIISDFERIKKELYNFFDEEYCKED